MHIKITVTITNNIRVRLENRSESTVFTFKTKRMSKPILKTHRKLKTYIICSLVKDTLLHYTGRVSKH